MFFLRGLTRRTGMSCPHTRPIFRAEISSPRISGFLRRPPVSRRCSCPSDIPLPHSSSQQQGSCIQFCRWRPSSRPPLIHASRFRYRLRSFQSKARKWSLPHRPVRCVQQGFFRPVKSPQMPRVYDPQVTMHWFHM